MRTPEDLILPRPSKHIELSPRLVKSSAPNQATVQITVLADGEAIGTREVTLRLKYNCRTVVTLTEIPVGGVISPENVKIAKTLSNYPEPANWSPPYGLIAKRRLPANTVIPPDMVGSVEPAIVVRRNETVLIRIERPGFLVTAMGTALKEARPGECVKVRNVDSQRIILCKVNEDGTVEPIL
jgi:flagella basal body P-ring formation protein FlgA